MYDIRSIYESVCKIDCQLLQKLALKCFRSLFITEKNTAHPLQPYRWQGDLNLCVVSTTFNFLTRNIGESMSSHNNNWETRTN